MTRKDYIRTAIVLGNASIQENPREYIIQSLNKWFEDDNPRFNSDRFLEKIKDIERLVVEQLNRA